jgi:hypothetical protein
MFEMGSVTGTVHDNHIRDVAGWSGDLTALP